MPVFWEDMSEQQLTRAVKLPLNCEVEYFSNFLTENEATQIFQDLIEKYEISKSRLVIEAGGRTIETDSFKILFVSERIMTLNSHPESIHGRSFLWEGKLADLRNKIEKFTNKKFEIAMCLYYPNGNYFAPFHFDQQTSGEKTIIPSISLGAEREFAFKENTNGQIYSLNLAHGSLLLMRDFCQSRYVHSLVKNSKYKKGRINITFREPEFK